MRNHPIRLEAQIFARWTLALFLLLYGCAAKTRAKPPTIPAQTNMAPQVKEQSNPSALPGESVSALDALKRDKLPVTPDSSPLKDIFFDFDRADLRADARETLKSNADWLRSHPAAPVEIEGYCDERGPSE
jgi:peptidoglycan-associated lipoprotein